MICIECEHECHCGDKCIYTESGHVLYDLYAPNDWWRKILNWLSNDRGSQDELLLYRFINLMLVTLALCGGPSVQ